MDLEDEINRKADNEVKEVIRMMNDLSEVFGKFKRSTGNVYYGVPATLISKHLNIDIDKKWNELWSKGNKTWIDKIMLGRKHIRYKYNIGCQSFDNKKV